MRKEDIRKEVVYICTVIFDFSKNGLCFSDKIYIETECKKNPMYGEVGISRGYKFNIFTNEPFEFKIYSVNDDPFNPKTGKEGIIYDIKANSVQELINKITDKIYEIIPN